MSDDIIFLWIICGVKLFPGTRNIYQNFTDWLYTTEEDAKKIADEYSINSKTQVYLARFKNELFIFDGKENE